MSLARLVLLFSLSILLGTLVTQAQTTSNIQGYPQVGPPPSTDYSGIYSALYLDASQFCSQGFNFTQHGCNPYPYDTGMWEAIAAASGSLLNISGVIDARAFQGNQLVTFNVGTTALYGTNKAGTKVDGVLLLGNVTSYCDGPPPPSGPAGTYTDGNQSNYGTPCFIVPWGFQIIGTAPLASTFAVCGTGTYKNGEKARPNKEKIELKVNLIVSA